jgi:hypothetical protein
LAILLGSLLWLPQAVGQDKQKNYRGGQDSNFPWTTKDINACRDDGKPILLYVYDPGKDDKFNNPAARVYETEILANQFVKDAFAEFTPVRVTVKSDGWPPLYLTHADKSVAVWVLTCDGGFVTQSPFTQNRKPQRVVDHNKRPTYPELLVAAKFAVDRNPIALDQMKKKPLPRWEPPAKVQPVAAAQGQPKVEAPVAVPLVPGLKEGEKVAEQPKAVEPQPAGVQPVEPNKGEVKPEAKKNGEPKPEEKKDRPPDEE